MSTGNPKDKSNRRPIRVRATKRTTDPDSQLLARMRRAIAPEKTDAESKPLSVKDQIYLQFQLDRVDRQGFYQQSRRHRDIEPLDELLGPDEEETKDAEARKPDEPTEED